MPGAEHPFAIGSDTWPGLAYLSEECGELVQAIAKRLAFLDVEVTPNGTNLIEALENEIGDVMGALSYVVGVNGGEGRPLDLERINARSMEKMGRCMRWDAEERARRAMRDL